MFVYTFILINSIYIPNRLCIQIAVGFLFERNKCCDKFHTLFSFIVTRKQDSYFTVTVDIDADLSFLFHKANCFCKFELNLIMKI